jgi:two-component system, HptB-dependent secretion and biofilm response regulator
MPGNQGFGKLALVVDSSTSESDKITQLLVEQGYRVITAFDGLSGIEQYIHFQPDLVLMDIDLPYVNGFDAARKIKQLSPRSLAPLIFITDISSDEAYVEAIEAGGDGVLIKPFSAAIFKAKIKSIQRISNLYMQVRTLQLEQQQDTELAEQLFREAIESKNYATDKINVLKKPAAIFSGDIQISVLCPNGNVHVLLGDFTGHGLRSTIGAIPLAETFRTMSRKGFALYDIIKQVNMMLYDLLPTDIFLAACFISISSHDDSAYLFNAGLPNGYLFANDGEIKNEFSSCHPPIGVMPSLLANVPLLLIPIQPTDRLVLLTDGVIEARNCLGEMFDVDRLIQAIRQGIQAQDVVGIVDHQVMMFCQEMEQEDDITLLDIPCDWPTLTELEMYHFAEYSNANKLLRVDRKDEANAPLWRWSIELTAKRLVYVNPIPLAMNQIQEIEGAGEHWQNLYTILTELFVNALDHGVLRLNSNLKNSPDGFLNYFTERAHRLDILRDGFVNIHLSYYALATGGQMFITVKDSGKGFDTFQFFKQKLRAETDIKQFSGRGIMLIEKLCDTLEYSEAGSLVEASYIWS